MILALAMSASFTYASSFTVNYDSLCWEMEKRFVKQLNEIRRSRGLGQFEYDHDMHALLTLPHNEWQVARGAISHGTGYNSFSNRTDRAGIGWAGECCASNHTADFGEPSKFLAQYKGSPPHWAILMDPGYVYIATSIIYDPEKDKFYSVVNVRR